MFCEYSIAYRHGTAFVNGQWVPAGTVGASALNIPRETVSELDSLRASGRMAALADMLNTLDCVKAAAYIAVDEAAGTLDDIVCFRVYLRRFLGKYFAGGASGTDALDEFLSDLDGLVRQLSREENLRRTALPAFCSAQVCFRAEDGVVCERIVFPTLCELLVYDVMRALEYGAEPRLCPVCGEYFIPERRNSHYCSRACRDRGVRESYAERTADSEPKKLYARACGRVYTRRSRGRLTAEEADAMIARCAALRDSALAGELSPEELEREFELATALPVGVSDTDNESTGAAAVTGADDK